MEQNEFVAAVPKWFHSANHVLGTLEEIGNENRQSTPPQNRLKFKEGMREISPLAERSAINAVQQSRQLTLP